MTGATDCSGGFGCKLPYTLAGRTLTSASLQWSWLPLVFMFLNQD